MRMFIRLGLFLCGFIAVISAEEAVPPVPLEMPTPAYPHRLFRKAIDGRVVVEFVIGSDGAVKEVRVVRSTDPIFDQPAIDAVWKWRFKPGRKNGRPVNTRAQQSIEFTMPKTDFIYPYDQLQKGIDGSATIGYWMDANGELERAEIITASDPVFGQAAMATLQADYATRSYPPTAEHGMFRGEYTFKCDGSGSAMVSGSARRILKLLKTPGNRFFTEGELDKPLVPQVRTAPLYPLGLRSAGPAGTALIEFFVDEKGHAQLPRVVSASHEDFGFAAAQAVGQWQFEPPRKNKKPVIVRVQVPIDFPSRKETKPERHPNSQEKQP